MLTIETIHRKLIDLGLISKASIMNGDYEATSIQRRNRNIHVKTLTEGSYLIKQVFSQSSDNSKTLTKEIQFYHYMLENPLLFAELTATPRFVDIAETLLIVDYFVDSVPLWKYYRSQAAKDIPQQTVSALGKMLGRFHRHASLSEINTDKLHFLDNDLPFGFKLDQPSPNILGHIHPGGIEFYRKLQSNRPLMEAWNKATESWEVNSLIHGDVKLDNILVLDGESNPTSTHLRLIDWELVQFGDRTWDIASVFQDFIFFWAISLPQKKTAQEMLKNARFSITDLAPAINVFWQSYIKECEIGESQAVALLNKIIIYSGIRCCQTAYEISSKFDNFPPIAEIIFGLGSNIILSPEKATTDLFGIALPSNKNVSQSYA